MKKLIEWYIEQPDVVQFMVGIPVTVSIIVLSVGLSLFIVISLFKLIWG